MAISLGLRPRNDSERRRVQALVHDALAVVGIGSPDDGWLSAITDQRSNTRLVQRRRPRTRGGRARKLGLPPLGSGTPDAIIDSSLRHRPTGRSRVRTAPRASRLATPGHRPHLHLQPSAHDRGSDRERTGPDLAASSSSL